MVQLKFRINGWFSFWQVFIPDGHKLLSSNICTFSSNLEPFRMQFFIHPKRRVRHLCLRRVTDRIPLARPCMFVHVSIFFFSPSPPSVLYLLCQATNESSLWRRNLIWANLTAAAKVRRAECHFNPINFNLLVIKELDHWRMAVSQALYYTG